MNDKEDNTNITNKEDNQNFKLLFKNIIISSFVGGIIGSLIALFIGIIINIPLIAIFAIVLIYLYFYIKNIYIENNIFFKTQWNFYLSKIKNSIKNITK